MSHYSEQLAEALSALMDGEATDIETRRVLKALSSSEDPQAQRLREKWQRYQTVSSIAQGGDVSNIDISSSIALAIEQEATLSKGLTSTILGASGRFAVAASVALIAILGVQQINQPLNLSDENSSFAQIDETPLDDYAGPVNQYPAGWFLPEDTQVQVVSSELYSEKEVRAYLRSIVNKHSSNTPYIGSQGILPYARLEQLSPAKPSE
jgi:sigma-E factor negative regulatory protein RseA